MRRDKTVAHNEVTDKTLFPNVTWKQAEQLGVFAEGFLAAIGFEYLSLGLSDHQGEFFLRKDAPCTSHALSGCCSRRH